MSNCYYVIVIGVPVELRLNCGLLSGCLADGRRVERIEVRARFMIQSFIDSSFGLWYRPVSEMSCYIFFEKRRHRRERNRDGPAEPADRCEFNRFSHFLH